MKKGNQNARKPADARKHKITIMLSPSERAYFAALGGGMVARGIHIAHDALAGERPLRVVSYDGKTARIAATEGYQLAVMDGQIVMVYVWHLPDGVGVEPLDSDPARLKLRDPEEWGLARDVEPVVA